MTTQSAKDALADAETFRLNYRRTSRGRVNVIRDADWLSHSLRWVADIQNHIDLLVYVAQRSAAAAFRAVPGLRG